MEVRGQKRIDCVCHVRSERTYCDQPVFHRARRSALPRAGVQPARQADYMLRLKVYVYETNLE